MRAGREVERILLAEGIETGPQIDETIDRCRKASIPIERVPRDHLDRLAHTRHHQGVVAVVSDTRYSTLEDILAVAASRKEPPLVAVLDGIEDPQNLGAIVRTVECAGAHGVVIPERRAASVSPGSIRAAAGATEHVKIARVTNLVRSIEYFKQAGLWVYGLAGDGDRTHWDADLARPTVLVIGAEGAGISRLVREKCDVLVRLPLLGKVESLNASVAAAIALYEAVRQRRAGLA